MHNQYYESDEVPDWKIWLGAAVCMVGVCAAITILFTYGG